MNASQRHERENERERERERERGGEGEREMLLALALGTPCFRTVLFSSEKEAHGAACKNTDALVELFSLPFF